MTTETQKAKIKELNKMVKSLSEDVTAKTALIETQASLIKRLKTDNSDLQEALFIKDEELVDSEIANRKIAEHHQDRENKAKARLSITQQLVSDTLKGLNF